MRPHLKYAIGFCVVIYADAVVAAFLSESDFFSYRVLLHEVFDELLTKSWQERFCLRSVAFGLLRGLLRCRSGFRLRLLSHFFGFVAFAPHIDGFADVDLVFIVCEYFGVM